MSRSAESSVEMRVSSVGAVLVVFHLPVRWSRSVVAMPNILRNLDWEIRTNSIKKKVFNLEDKEILELTTATAEHEVLLDNMFSIRNISVAARSLLRSRMKAVDYLVAHYMRSEHIWQNVGVLLICILFGDYGRDIITTPFALIAAQNMLTILWTCEKTLCSIRIFLILIWLNCHD